MGLPVLKISDLYAELEALPENLVGEIINGRLIAMPRPAGPHGQAGSSLGADIHLSYQRGRGGPGGWWIIDEPEVHFVRDVEVVVPDIAGWRRERMVRPPQGHRYEVVPDWVCEILSPSTATIVALVSESSDSTNLLEISASVRLSVSKNSSWWFSYSAKNSLHRARTSSRPSSSRSLRISIIRSVSRQEPVSPFIASTNNIGTLHSGGTLYPVRLPSSRTASPASR